MDRSPSIPPAGAIERLEETRPGNLIPQNPPPSATERSRNTGHGAAPAFTRAVPRRRGKDDPDSSRRNRCEGNRNLRRLTGVIPGCIRNRAMQAVLRRNPQPEDWEKMKASQQYWAS